MRKWNKKYKILKKKKFLKNKFLKVISNKKNKKTTESKSNFNETLELIRGYIPTLSFLKNKEFFDDKFTFVEKSEERGKTSVNIIIPKFFSIIKNPDEVFNVLKKLVGIYREKNIKEISFDYSKCNELELGAVLLKNVICLNLKKQGITMSGNVPKGDSSTIGMFIFSGLYNVLGLDPHKMLKKYDNEPLRLPLFGGGKDFPDICCKKMESGITETRITTYFNNCLKKFGMSLKEEGERIFDNIISEVMTNCKEHSGEFNQYFCLGYLDGFKYSDRYVGKYHFSIFNFGQSIAEGLEESTLPEKTKIKIDELIKIHSKKKLFSPTWDRESLLTLYSLQNRVSRVYDQKSTRGTGTVKFLKAFREVGGTIIDGLIPEMSIISGKTQILIDNSDICSLSPKKQVAFNKTNDLELPPDIRYVKKIDTYFPGTIITMSVYLDKEWVEKKMKKDEKNETNKT
ncbi:hypothetical protein [uncultured Ilyobacter sp.]|uniref:hypothetical protein n=1 Tax=uncultured Ilyobacter sp. TaxID=544433 RepID=UPI0029C0CD6E|nr:hypothetical protein [uncultured Ilyobacter sp.]